MGPRPQLLVSVLKSKLRTQTLSPFCFCFAFSLALVELLLHAKYKILTTFAWLVTKQDTVVGSMRNSTGSRVRPASIWWPLFKDKMLSVFASSWTLSFGDYKHK